MQVRGYRFVRSYAFVGLLLTALTLAFESYLFRASESSLLIRQLAQLVNITQERNLGTLFHFFGLLAAGFLLRLHAVRSRADAWKWLSWLFVLLALDEVSCLHERTAGIAEVVSGRPMSLVWILGAIPLAIAVAALFKKSTSDWGKVERGQLWSGLALYFLGTVLLKPVALLLMPAQGMGTMLFFIGEDFLKIAGCTLLLLVLSRSLRGETFEFASD